MSADLVEIKPAQAVGKLPGEISGPALRVVVRIRNQSGVALDLSSAVVNLYTGAGVPASAFLSDPGPVLTGSVPAGDEVEGSYLFAVPASDVDPVKVEVIYAGAAPVAVFQGDVS